MLINGNLVGFGMVVISALVIAVPGLLLKLPVAPVMICVGIVLVLADLVLRTRHRGKPKWLTDQRTGGYLFFMPVWIFGIVMMVLNVVNAFVAKK